MTVGSDLEGKAEIRVAIVTSGEQIETATVRGKNSNSFFKYSYVLQGLFLASCTLGQVCWHSI